MISSFSWLLVFHVEGLLAFLYHFHVTLPKNKSTFFSILLLRLNLTANLVSLVKTDLELSTSFSGVLHRYSMCRTSLQNSVCLQRLSVCQQLHRDWHGYNCRLHQLVVPLSWADAPSLTGHFQKILFREGIWLWPDPRSTDNIRQIRWWSLTARQAYLQRHWERPAHLSKTSTSTTP